MEANSINHSEIECNTGELQLVLKRGECGARKKIEVGSHCDRQIVRMMWSLFTFADWLLAHCQCTLQFGHSLVGDRY